MSRPLAALASVILTVVGLVVLLPDCASACSCGGFEGSQREIVERALSHPGAVFSGEVVEVDKGSQISTVTLRVNEVWKGPQRETIQVSTPSQGPPAVPLQGGAGVPRLRRRREAGP